MISPPTVWCGPYHDILERIHGLFNILAGFVIDTDIFRISAYLIEIPSYYIYKCCQNSSRCRS